MTAKSLSKSGSCRCGHVQFTAAPPVLSTMACHCKGCQRMTGSAFSLSALYSGPNFHITKGEPVVGGMKAYPAHFMCPQCSSWVFTRIPTPTGELVNVRTSMFDDMDQAAPYFETCTSEKLAWVNVGAVHSFEKFPPSEQFGDLMTDYLEATK
jgi:hypothetical protein